MPGKAGEELLDHDRLVAVVAGFEEDAHSALCADGPISQCDGEVSLWIEHLGHDLAVEVPAGLLEGFEFERHAWLAEDGARAEVAEAFRGRGCGRGPERASRAGRRWRPGRAWRPGEAMLSRRSWSDLLASLNFRPASAKVSLVIFSGCFVVFAMLCFRHCTELASWCLSCSRPACDERAGAGEGYYKRESPD